MKRILLGAGRPILFAAAIIATAAGSAWGHNNPTLVTANGGKLALVSTPSTPLMFDTGFGPYTEDVNFGVNQPNLGPPSGTRIELETVGGLLYWDGQTVLPTEAEFVIEPPLFDSDGVYIPNEIESYVIDADSPPLSGMNWATYQGGFFWEAHGSANFPSSGLATGVYGVPVRLNSPTLEPSDPFVIAFGWNMGVLDRQAGAQVLARLVVAPTVSGDYDYDGTVTQQDYVAWKSDFGLTVVVPGAGADGNSDGVVNAADFTIWRDLLGGSAGLVVSQPVSEPGSVSLAAACIALATVYAATKKSDP